MLLAQPITVALPRGLSKAICSKNGNQLTAFYGCKAYVRISLSRPYIPLIVSDS